MHDCCCLLLGCVARIRAARSGEARSTILVATEHEDTVQHGGISNGATWRAKLEEMSIDIISNEFLNRQEEN